MFLCVVEFCATVLYVVMCSCMLYSVVTCYQVLLHAEQCCYMLHYVVEFCATVLCCDVFLYVVQCCYMLPRVTTCCAVLLRVISSYYMMCSVVICYQGLLHAVQCCYVLSPVITSVQCCNMLHCVVEFCAATLYVVMCSCMLCMLLHVTLCC